MRFRGRSPGVGRGAVLRSPPCRCVADVLLLLAFDRAAGLAGDVARTVEASPPTDNRLERDGEKLVKVSHREAGSVAASVGADPF